MTHGGKMLRVIGVTVGALVMSASLCAAQAVRLTEDRAEMRLQIGGASVVVARTADADGFPVCPPSCLQPLQPAPGVVTLGELELIGFLESQVATGRGVLIDARLPQDAAQGVIPAAVNVPYVTLAPNNPYRDDILTALGAAVRADGSFDFAAAVQIAVYGGGPAEDAAPRAIRLLMNTGYPAEKLQYYRGGMQDWRLLGLTVVPLTDHKEGSG